MFSSVTKCYKAKNKSLFSVCLFQSKNVQFLLIHWNLGGQFCLFGGPSLNFLEWMYLLVLYLKNCNLKNYIRVNVGEDDLNDGDIQTKSSTRQVSQSADRTQVRRDYLLFM